MDADPVGLPDGLQKAGEDIGLVKAPECPHLSRTWLWLIESTCDTEWIHLQNIIVHELNM